MLKQDRYLLSKYTGIHLFNKSAQKYSTEILVFRYKTKIILYILIEFREYFEHFADPIIFFHLYYKM